jgi:putative membrane protein
MALADSVPGVSGGTIAFLLGFYDRFITSIDDLLTGTKEQRKEAFFFLIKLGIGWVCGMILAVLILASVFESHIYAISSLFIGFIIFAIPIVVKEEKATLTEHKGAIPFVLLGVAVVSAITYFNPVSGGAGVNLDHLTVGLGLFVFFAGMIAISAMVLPGISGSTLLLIMGLYLPVVTAVKDILHLDLSTFPTVFIFGCGVLVGIFSVVKLIRKALERFRGQTMYTIIGLMIGSIYAVIMGPTTLDTPQAAMSIHTFSPLFFIIGGVIIVGMQLMKNRKDGKVQEA